MRVFPRAEQAYANGSGRSLTELFSPVEEYTVPMSGPYAIAIRPIIRYSDYSMNELTYYTVASYGLIFESQDPNVCIVRADGLIMPVSAGKTQIKVTCNGGLSYLVDVNVIE